MKRKKLSSILGKSVKGKLDETVEGGGGMFIVFRNDEGKVVFQVSTANVYDKNGNHFISD